MKKFRLLLWSVLLILFDQLTKYLVTVKIKGKQPIKIIDGVFELVYHENDGAVWGILSGKTVFLLIFTIIALALIAFVFYRLPEEKRFTPIRIILIFIVAGAIGNLIDRVLYGYVIDFLYFSLIDFPVFNVADIYITVSAILLMILGVFYYKEEDYELIFAKKQK